jgi:hypothetical protein
MANEVRNREAFSGGASFPRMSKPPAHANFPAIAGAGAPLSKEWSLGRSGLQNTAQTSSSAPRKTLYV